MDFVTDAIAIGTYVEARDRELLVASEITGMLCLARDRMADPPPAGVEKDSWPLEDGRGNARSDIAGALGKLDRLLGRHARVLVHCNAGKSRSCGVVAVWLARKERLTLEAAIARVAEKRPALWITPDFREVLELAAVGD
jgi:hypothetical protein